MRNRYKVIIDNLDKMTDAAAQIVAAYVASERDRPKDPDLVNDINEVLRSNPDLPNNIKDLDHALMDMYEELFLRWRDEGKLSEKTKITKDKTVSVVEQLLDRK